MTFEEVLDKVAEQETMPDFDNMKFKDNITLEDLRQSIIKLCKRSWESDKLMADAVAVISGAALVELDRDTGKTTIISREALVEKMEKHLGMFQWTT